MPRFFQALHRTALQLKALAFQPIPCLARPIALVILIPNTFDLCTKFCFPLIARRSFLRISETGQAFVKCLLRDQQNPQNRLDTVINALIFNKADQRFCERQSFACANHVDALCRISFAELNSRISHSIT